MVIPESASKVYIDLMSRISKSLIEERDFIELLRSKEKNLVELELKNTSHMGKAKIFKEVMRMTFKIQTFWTVFK